MSDDPDEGSVRRPAGAPDAEQQFGWRGWVLVGVLVVSLLVVPVAIVALPAARGALEAIGLGFTDAYLVLPLVPAFLLGAVAVWSAVRSRSR